MIFASVNKFIFKTIYHEKLLHCHRVNFFRRIILQKNEHGKNHPESLYG